MVFSKNEVFGQESHMGGKGIIFQQDVEIFIVAFFDKRVEICGKLVGGSVTQGILHQFQHFGDKMGLFFQGCDFN